jgi:hypothetical protein
MEDNIPNDRELNQPGIAPLSDADSLSATNTSAIDPADEIPVPIAMSAAEIDERAQAVEAVRGTTPDSASSETIDSDSRTDA